MADILEWEPHMTASDKPFYKGLGQRISRLRKEHGLTQVQLAEQLGIAQQTMAHYEAGNLRVAVALLKPIAHALDVSIEELIDEPKPATKGKRGPSSKLQQQIEEISSMPRSKQKMISEMLDAFILQQKAG